MSPGDHSSTLDSDDLLRLVFESATDFAIFTLDPNGIVTSWNPGAERLLGFSEAEIVGQSADVIFPPEEGGSNAGEEERRNAVIHGRAEDERWQMRKDGSRFWASGLLMTLADQDHGFVKILRDRTDQHRIEDRIRESEELFRALATNIPQLVFRCRDSGARTWGSPQWSTYTGLDFAASLEFGWLDSIQPDDRESTLVKWREARESGRYDVVHRIRDARGGEYRWHQTRAIPLGPLESAVTEWVGTSTDIHELRMLQEQQRILLAELQHRTRNLLAVVQSISRRTQRSSRSLEEYAAEFESRLRALSRVQTVLVGADVREVELRVLVESELHAHKASNDSADKVSIVGAAETIPVGSAQTIALALHELCTNAVKYGALGQPGGKIRVEWKVRATSSGRCIVLCWTESGVLMPMRTRQGYGSELIERALPYQLSATTSLEFTPDGVHCEIALPVHDRLPVHDKALRASSS